MVDYAVPAVGRRSARAILIDEAGHLTLIKRTKPGQTPYWTTPGGGVEPSDASIEAALQRELAEELGAQVSGAVQVFLHSTPSESGVAIQHFLLARLGTLDTHARSGPEFNDSSRGGYDLDTVDLATELDEVDLKPRVLKEFIMANCEALLAEAAVMV